MPLPPTLAEPKAPSALRAELPPELGRIYEEHFDFVWRSLRRLGVPERGLDDAAHDVFLVVHRRIGEFEGRSSLRTWLFSIALRVAYSTRRAYQREVDPVDDDLAGPRDQAPDEQASRAETLRLGQRLLGQLDPGKRVVFIMADLEQLPGSEIAEVLEIPMYTVYSRLRAARREFAAALAREQARYQWRERWKKS